MRPFWLDEPLTGPFPSPNSDCGVSPQLQNVTDDGLLKGHLRDGHVHQVQGALVTTVSPVLTSQEASLSRKDAQFGTPGETSRQFT